MPDHNAHGVGFKRMRMAGLLPAAALILAVFASSAVSAAEVKLAGAVVSGLFLFQGRKRRAFESGSRGCR